MPSACGTIWGSLVVPLGPPTFAMWPSPCSPTRTVPSASRYSKSSGTFRPEASSSTGFEEMTPDATRGAAEPTHGGGGVGDGAGLGESLTCGEERATVLELHATATQATASAKARGLASSLSWDPRPCDGGSSTDGSSPGDST